MSINNMIQSPMGKFSATGQQLASSYRNGINTVIVDEVDAAGFSKRIKVGGGVKSGGVKSSGVKSGGVKSGGIMTIGELQLFLSQCHQGATRHQSLPFPDVTEVPVDNIPQPFPLLNLYPYPSLMSLCFYALILLHLHFFIQCLASSLWYTTLDRLGFPDVVYTIV